jgi:hypothetical protein
LAALMSLMFEALRACGRALANEKAGRARAGRGKATRGKAAVTFAARLTFEDVSRHYGATLALDHVSLDIAPGEIRLTRREAKTEAHAAFERVGLAHYVSEYPHGACPRHRAETKRAPYGRAVLRP